MDCIREILTARNVSARDLGAKLLAITAFSHEEQNLSLLSGHQDVLKNPRDLIEIFNLLVTKYASFLNYDIFQVILEKYSIDQAQNELLKYPEHLKDYVNKLKISEFISINPQLSLKQSTTSSKVTLKANIELTSQLARIVNLKTAVARILDVNSASLQLLDIKDGCVLITF